MNATQNYRFAAAGREDLPGLKQMAREIIIADYAPFLGTEATGEFIASGQADRELDEGFERCTVLFVAEVPVGFAIVDRNVLHLLMVDRRHRHREYGSMLLRHVEGRLFEEYARIELQTFKGNMNAIRLYLKNGWVVTGSEKTEGMPELVRFAKTGGSL